MKRIRLGARLPAMMFLAPLGGGIVWMLHGCVPDADISGLPPADASVPIGVDTFVPPVAEGGADVVAPRDAGDAGPRPEAGPQTATIVGVVIDYTQGNGKGVVPGATVSISNGTTVTADARGVFAIPAAAGHVLLNVSKATDKTLGIAYSTMHIPVDVTAGQTVSVFPVLHEGCVFTKQLSAITQPTTFGSQQGACQGRTGAFMALRFAINSFTRNGATFAGTARFEMIPLAYPSPQLTGSVPSLAWALGLPGASTPIDLLGAAEIRVFDDSSGDALEVSTVTGAVPVTLTLPITAAAQGTLASTSYDAVNGVWKTEAPVPSTPQVVGSSPQVNTMDIVVPHISWWGITRAANAKSCVTGALTAAGAPAANVWVHGAGVDWLGTSSAVTDAAGNFCLDVKASSKVLVSAGVASAGQPHFVAQATTQVGGASGSCATLTGCTALGTIDLPAIAGACASGRVLAHDGGAPVTTALNVRLEGIKLGAQDPTVGISSTAYAGQLTPAADGTFCSPAPAGASVRLLDPSGSCNSAPPQFTQPPLAIPAQQAAATCAGGGCLDAGDIFYGCY